MKLSSLLNENLIEIRDSIGSKGEAIDLLVDKIFNSYKFKRSKEELIKAIYDREKLECTTFDNGIAIPHARLEEYSDLIIGVLLLKKAAVFDGKEVKMMILIMTSKTSSKIYLNTLAAFAKISMNKELFENLLNCSDSAEYTNLIKNSGISVKEELTVESIMNEKVITVSPQSTLAEVIDNFCIHDILYAPVVDNTGKFIGEINIKEIIKTGIPDYATQIGNLSFLSSFEPFEELLKNEDSIKIGDIMKKPVLQFEANASIIEVAFSLSKFNKRHAPVIKDDKIIGVVGLKDIMKKVLRG